VVLGRAEGADDVVQQATERAWRAIDTFDVDRPFRPWFLRIVANGARNDRRASGRRAHLEVRVASADAARSVVTPEEVAVTDGERQRVVAALNQLDGDDRLVIALRWFEQLSEAEMADALDVPAGTVKSRLSRAMSRLKAALEAEGALHG
jgi:RNA polymerase sigma-70 factor (ECF subfamily)